MDHIPAIYLFGSYGTEQEWPESDVDIAVLLTPKEPVGAGFKPALTKSNSGDQWGKNLFSH
jgi:predicted nucleotidyltransferase